MVSIISNLLNVIVVEDGSNRSTEYAKADYTFSVTTRAFWVQEDAGDLAQHSINLVDILAPEFDINNPNSLLIALGLLAAPVEPNQTVDIGNQPVQTTPNDVTGTITKSHQEVDTFTKPFAVPLIDKEYILFMFRAKSLAPDPEGIVTVTDAFVAALSNTNDDTLIRVVANPVITQTIEESYWEDISYDSKLEYIRPKITGLSGFDTVPTALDVTGCDKKIFGKPMRDKGEISERIPDDIIMPTDGSFIYAITVSAMTAGAKVWAAASFIEKHVTG